MRIAFVALLAASTVLAQPSSFRAPDKAMAPALTAGSSYTLAPVDSLRKGRIAVFVRNGRQTARRIVGLFDDRRISQDRDFTKRALSSWQFVSIDENRIVWLSNDTPMNTANPPSTLADLSVYTKILQMPLDTYERQPELGFGKFFVHADTRKALVNEANVTFEDSREWDVINLSDIVGVILPGDEED
ncbi:MAG: hypothetical protein OXI35_14720 [Gemmatimonadota bacterium]|nr:hypothetical protein [Gemmatimonadota bacterium]